MESYSNMLSLFLAILLSLSSTEAITASHNVSIQGDATHVRTNIIRVRPPENLTITCSEDLTNWYKSFLLLATMKSADFQFIYTYSEAIIGFAANLTEDEVRCVEQNDNFLQANPDHMLPVSTTHTPDFLGLQINGGLLWKRSNMGKGIIIGMVDDDGLPPSPSKWKGACDFTDLGNANGTAAGTAPYAKLAIYQVCDFSVCYGVDILQLSRMGWMCCIWHSGAVSCLLMQIRSPLVTSVQSRRKSL